MSKKQQDLDFGISKETELLETIRSLPFCEDVVKTTCMYDFIDFESETTFCELKSRRIKHNQFDTALIGCNKITKMKRNGKQYNYLVWNYLDGIFYLKYDPNTFTFPVEEQKVWRDGKCEISPVHKIPYQILTKV